MRVPASPPPFGSKINTFQALARVYVRVRVFFVSFSLPLSPLRGGYIFNFTRDPTIFHGFFLLLVPLMPARGFKTAEVRAAGSFSFLLLSFPLRLSRSSFFASRALISVELAFVFLSQPLSPPPSSFSRGYEQSR